MMTGSWDLLAPALLLCDPPAFVVLSPVWDPGQVQGGGEQWEPEVRGASAHEGGWGMGYNCNELGRLAAMQTERMLHRTP